MDSSLRAKVANVMANTSEREADIDRLVYILYSPSREELRPSNKQPESEGVGSVDQITLRNFRCFQQEQNARLAPLTLLVGENSTGKTSFLAMLRALWDVAYQQSIPDFKEEPYDLGSFDEIAHHRGGRGGRADTFEAGFEIALSEGKGRRAVTNGVDRYHFEVSFGRNGTVPVPVRRRLSGGATWIEEHIGEGESQRIRFGTSKGAWQFRERADLRTFLDADRYRMIPLLLHFKNFKASVGSRRKQRNRSGTDDTTRLRVTY